MCVIVCPKQTTTQKTEKRSTKTACPTYGLQSLVQRKQAIDLSFIVRNNLKNYSRCLKTKAVSPIGLYFGRRRHQRFECQRSLKQSDEQHVKANIDQQHTLFAFSNVPRFATHCRRHRFVEPQNKHATSMTGQARWRETSYKTTTGVPQGDAGAAGLAGALLQLHATRAEPRRSVLSRNHRFDSIRRPSMLGRCGVVDSRVHDGNVVII